MTDMRSFRVDRLALAPAIVMLFCSAAFGQETDDQATDESEVIDEIVVVEPKPGDRRRVDKEYEDPTRAQLLKELYEMQTLEEEYEWRKSGAAKRPSRIKWGYDPRDEYRLRSEMNLQDLPSEQIKPATSFKIQF